MQYSSTSRLLSPAIATNAKTGEAAHLEREAGFSQLPHRRAVLENDFIVVKKVRHGLFMFNRNDRFIGSSLHHYGEWCESEITLLNGLLSPGDTVVDISANIGTHTVAFANAV